METALTKESQTAVQRRPETIKDLLESKKPDIKSLLPAHVDVNRFVKSALLAIARNNQLAGCTPMSLFTAVVNAAELGLDFTPAKRHAYLVKYGNQAQFMPGYGGLIELALRGGKVKRMEAQLVHEKDEFDIQYGTDPKITHKPFLDGDSGKVKGAYAVAWYENGESQFEYMTLAQLSAIRERSKTKSSGPWVSDTGEMQRKTVIRRLFKYIPSSPDLDKAIEFDNQAVGIEDIPVSDSTSRTADLADMITAEYEEVNTETGEVKEPPKEEKKAEEPKKGKKDADGLFSSEFPEGK